MNVTATGLDRRDGSLVTFHAATDDGRPVVVAVDHRMAHAIERALLDGPTAIAIEPWQIVPTVPCGWCDAPVAADGGRVVYCSADHERMDRATV